MAAKTTPKDRQFRLTKLRTELLFDEPFFGNLVMRLPMIEDRKCKTMWVNGVTIGYNPKFVDHHSDEEVKGVILHEVLHVANGHCWRRGDRDPRDWNEACDYAINPIVLGSGFVLPGGVLLNDEFKGLSAEQIYDAIHQPRAGSSSRQDGSGQSNDAEAPNGAPSPNQDDHGEDEEENSELSGSRADNDADVDSLGDDTNEDEASDDEDDDSGEDDSGTGKGDADDSTGDDSGDGSKSSGSAGVDDELDPNEPVGEVRDAPPDVDPKQLEREWKQAIEQAAKAATRRGRLPGELRRHVKELLKPTVNWVEVLWQFVQQSWTAADYTWRMPSARYLAQELYLPRLASESLPCVIIVTDTSGSIWGRLLAAFQAEMSAIIEQMRPEEAYVVYADAAVQRVDRFEAGEPVEFHHVGGGGTDFRPVFDWVEKEGHNPVCLVYLTDLEGVFPDKEPPYPVLWVTPPTQRRAPWGQHVEMRV